MYWGSRVDISQGVNFLRVENKHKIVLVWLPFILVCCQRQNVSHGEVTVTVLLCDCILTLTVYDEPDSISTSSRFISCPSVYDDCSQGLYDSRIQISLTRIFRVSSMRYTLSLYDLVASENDRLSWLIANSLELNKMMTMMNVVDPTTKASDSISKINKFGRSSCIWKRSLTTC